MTEIIATNKFQTAITKELLEQYPEEVRDSKGYIVYRHISPCGKVYVGITKLSLSERWGKEGCRYKRCKLFYRAIRKYGWSNIIHNVVLDSVSKSEAIYTERYLIRWYKSHNMSYNITDGGESTAGIHMPESARKRISKYLKEHMGRAVLQYTIDGKFVKEYSSAQEAATALGYGHTSVSNCAHWCNGKHTLHGYIFIYKDEIDSLPQRLNYCAKHWKKYRIIQYKDGEPINEFESIRDASRCTGINRLCISRNIRGIIKISGGCAWRKVIIK